MLLRSSDFSALRAFWRLTRQSSEQCGTKDPRSSRSGWRASHLYLQFNIHRQPISNPITQAPKELSGSLKSQTPGLHEIKVTLLLV